MRSSRRPRAARSASLASLGAAEHGVGRHEKSVRSPSHHSRLHCGQTRGADAIVGLRCGSSEHIEDICLLGRIEERHSITPTLRTDRRNCTDCGCGLRGTQDHNEHESLGLCLRRNEIRAGGLGALSASSSGHRVKYMPANNALQRTASPCGLGPRRERRRWASQE